MKSLDAEYWARAPQDTGGEIMFFFIAGSTTTFQARVRFADSEPNLPSRYSESAVAAEMNVCAVAAPVHRILRYSRCMVG